MTDAEARAYAAESVAVTGAPARLAGGLMNEVWRVPGRPSVIVKHAPPHIASAPEIPLDPHRIEIEGRCLELLGPGGALERIATDAARPPRLLAMDAEAHRLAMEDVGDAPHLGVWLEEAGNAAGQAGAHLGAFIGALHRETAGDTALRADIDNRSIQETRLQVQYRAIGAILNRCGVADAEALGAEAEALGERLLRPGRCLVMGDLWPPSVLVTPAGLRVIDWEFAHFGNPAQDVAHLAAHLWMIGHRRPESHAAACWRGFRGAYAMAVCPVRESLWDADTERDAAVHYAAEILVRAAGAFQGGYLYDGLPADAPAVQEAVRRAVDRLRGGAIGWREGFVD
ncbi:MAG: phosphotransferase [Rhodothermales bacterium]